MKAKFFSQISDHPQRMAPRSLRGAFLIPPALLVVADLRSALPPAECFIYSQEIVYFLEP
jgi:hypothetical protein